MDIETSPALALEVVNLHKKFGATHAVQGLRLGIRTGEFYALLGPNGAGKTTTLRMVAGLLRPDAGQVRIFGVDVVEQPEQAKRPLAWVPDEPMLYDKLRGLEYLEFVAGLWGMGAAAAAPRAQQLLEWLGLWEQRDAYAETYSKGMRQKLALAGALMHEPKLLILDEPLTGLDAAAARQVKDLLKDIVRKGATVVLTTHILEVAERLAERIGIIASGRLIAEGTLDQLRALQGDSQGTLEDVFLSLTAQQAG
ncbi:ABC transporter ATP-binding protein [Nevskia soli]|uniref:ABC transporter ATP-binding protein n=1 Tax=Nevskia soli TaxID=418856 RepID=UPI0004A6E2E5|nr:ABC transporter ATP-binding protein [Nevskia soli]